MNKFTICVFENLAYILICTFHILVRVPVIPVMLVIVSYYMIVKGLFVEPENTPRWTINLYDWYSKGVPSKDSLFV